jgi:hypothetical protein
MDIRDSRHAIERTQRDLSIGAIKPREIGWWMGVSSGDPPLDKPNKSIPLITRVASNPPN